MKQIVVQYLKGCPNIQAVLDRLDEAGVEHSSIHLCEFCQDEPTPNGFAGSPTILINGTNPLGSPETEIGAACALRIPSVEELQVSLESL